MLKATHTHDRELRFMTVTKLEQLMLELEACTSCYVNECMTFSVKFL